MLSGRLQCSALATHRLTYSRVGRVAPTYKIVFSTAKSIKNRYTLLGTWSALPRTPPLATPSPLVISFNCREHPPSGASSLRVGPVCSSRTSLARLFKSIGNDTVRLYGALLPWEPYPALQELRKRVLRTESPSHMYWGLSSLPLQQP